MNMKKIVPTVTIAFLGVVAFAQPKFAHVNYAELIQLCPEADEARELMTQSRNEAQETYQAMVNEFNAKYETYAANSSNWTASIRQTKEQELTDIQQRIQQFSQNVDAELQQQQQQLMAPIYEKAMNVVKELAEAGGYIYVFDINSVLYCDTKQSTDLTPEARKALNIPEGRTLETLQAELQARAQQ